MRLRKVAAVLVMLLCAAPGLDAAPFVFVVRHAEKAATGGDDPELSEAGHQRADALARMLRDASVAQIFTTEFKRTQQTAARLAHALRVQPKVIPGKDVAQLVEALREAKGNVVVVGHGNTIPNILKLLGVDTPVSIPEDDYSEVFVVDAADKPHMVRMHYPF